MTDIHIEEFYADAGHTIISLYGVFPRPVTLFAEDICGPDEPDEYGVHGTRYLACFTTMLWLGEEGYIRFEDTIRQDAIDKAVLTGRCFAALLSQSPSPVSAPTRNGLPPSVQAHHATIAYQLQMALKSKSSTAIQAAFSPLLERMVR